MTSMRELRGMGVEIRRVQHSTPGSSATLDIVIENRPSAGVFQSIELIVHPEDVTTDNLLAAATADDAPRAALRRAKSSNRRSSFIVLRKELSKAYLSVQFASSNAESVRTYLFPVAKIEIEEEE